MQAGDNVQEIQQALVDNYNNYAEGLDSKNWPLVRSCFADEVFIDYGSISAPTGDPAIARVSDEWLKILQGVINGFDITRHQITNHRFTITDDEVSCRAYLSADHVIFANPEMPIVGPEDIVTVVGEYNNHYKLVAGVWKICRSELVVNWSQGNMGLFVKVAERVARQQQQQQQ